nr:MAG TPA_asm: hypothetical protein [Caudoviricetes sp.]
MRLFVILIIPRRAWFVKRSNKHLTKFYKYAIINSRRTAKTVGLKAEHRRNFTRLACIFSAIAP